MKDKNIVFMGTPEFSVPVLEMLIEKTNVIMVVTQPDKEVGRKKELVFSPVKKVAMEHKIPVFQPVRIRKDYEVLKGLDIDLIVTCAYGQIIPKEVLDLPKRGCVNVHASILPKYRGSAPIQWAIMNGDKKTGVTIMYMDEGMDTGDIIKCCEIPILDTDNVGTMHDKLSILGRDTLESVLDNLLNGIVIGIKQTDDYTMAPMIKREDEKINFSRTMRQVYNQVRGLNDFPGAYCIYEGKRLKVWECMESSNTYPQLLDGTITKLYDNGFGVKVSNGEVIFTVVQPDGKKRMDAKSYANGQMSHGSFVGKVLS